MQLALNGATTMQADLVSDIRIANDAGFAWLEIWSAKLKEFLRTYTPSDLNELFDQYQVTPYSINSIEHITFRDSEGFAQLSDECEEMCAIAEQIGCPYVVVVPSPLPYEADQEEVIEESVRTLRDIAGIAQFHSVSLAFEFLGQPGCSVPTLGLANEIIRQVDKPNVGLVLDSFHFYAGGSTLDDIYAVKPEKLYIFHINDAEDLPRPQLEDRHRLLPGLGILPLAEIVGALKKIGYEGVASIEIFRPEYWQREALTLARDAYAAAARIIEAAK